MHEHTMTLEELRETYGNAEAGLFIDENAKRISEIISRKVGFRPAPYAGFPTFLDAPSLDPSIENLETLQVALVGMPMDLAVTNRNGSRFGPRALRTIERVGPYNDGLNVAPVHELSVADIGDIPFRSRFHLDQCHADIEIFISKLVDAGVIPLSVGGDHSISHPILRVLGRDGPVGMVHIDAHCDTGGVYDLERFHHGAPFRNAVLDGVLDPKRTIQIGIRGPASFTNEFSILSGMTVVNAHEMDQMGIPAIIEKAREVVGNGPTYVSFDIDSLDPAFAPGTGTPEGGGLTPRETQAILRGLKGINLVGGDVVEVAPAYDATSNTAQNGAQMLFEILSLMMFSPSLPKKNG
ncbi:agmatinase [Falsochrobactrum sp. TDYN1]|uniref:Agmatinase n=1 Tax=Falsochrobactrum tianjinense TaxID=2706015 RepID=A0A949PN30_9HYPH|nr:agmatinase [Falsochrobactrum sp. TDYN1]MBV2143479.1 agmatinase [Falsochrobactrum sp. TDYN1]